MKSKYTVTQREQVDIQTADRRVKPQVGTTDFDCCSENMPEWCTKHKTRDETRRV